MIDLLEILRSVGFGAMLGGGLLGLFYALFPELFPASVTLRNLVILGALIGGGAHRLIEGWFISSFLKPVASSVAYYAKLGQLAMLGRFIGSDLQRELIREVTRQYFLGEREADRPTQGSLPGAPDGS